MKVKEEILEVISALEFDGKQARIVEQLDRKTYLAVNKVLTAVGGKWNRKAKAHVFPEDAQNSLEGVLTTGEVTTYKERGFFATPPALAEDLVSMAGVEVGDTVLEPSAGTGALVDAILEQGAAVMVIEYDQERSKHLREQYKACLNMDFMEFPPEKVYSKVVMNPPFIRVGKGDHLDHVQHAWRFLKEGGTLVSVLPSSVKFRRDRRYQDFKNWYERLGGEIEDLPEGSFKTSGTGVRTVVLKMQKEVSCG